VLGARRGEPLEAIPGAPSRLDTLPVGCTFAPRPCRADLPELRAIGPGRSARCVKAAQLATV
jgi:peptide/nickel transport system ATP-binding protein